MKKFLTVILAFTMIFCMTACGNSDDESSASGNSGGTAVAGETDWSQNERINQIKEAGKLVLGTSADYPPFEFHTQIDGTDTIVGFDIMIAQKIADALGVDLEIVDMSFNSLLIGLDRGDFDIVMASLSVTPEREEAVDFSEPYFKGSQVVLLRAEDAEKYTTTESLYGHPVAAQQGAIQVPLANEAAGEENVVQLVKVGDMVNELLNGKVDAVFLDNVIAAGYAAVHDDLVMADIGIEYESTGNVVACKTGDTDLIAFINEVIGGMSEEEINDMLLEAQAMAGISEE